MVSSGWGQKISIRMCSEEGSGGPGRVRHELGVGWGSDMGSDHGESVVGLKNGKSIKYNKECLD